ncbi:MAG: hypothetical protein EON60_03845 [Alphaproteobacteria bacterium]|nr:MAG: hypothetical protein EON60_03845 [Alphaproteobacteria bacterium]
MASPTATRICENILVLQSQLEAEVQSGGHAPRPALNALFKLLISIIQAPTDASDVADVLSTLNSPIHSATLNSLRTLCWDCEMAMEQDTARQIIAHLKAHGTPLGGTPSVTDQITHFETIARQYYPQPWGGLREAANIQQLLLPNLSAHATANLLVYGPSSLPYSRLYWVWAAALLGNTVNVTSVDPCPTATALGLEFITLMEEFNLIPAGALSMAPADTEFSRISGTGFSRIYSAAHVLQYPHAFQKEAVIDNLFNQGIPAASVTYPEGMVQLLYAPINLDSTLATTGTHVASGLISGFTTTPLVSGIPTLSPAGSDTLWLSSYILRRQP